MKYKRCRRLPAASCCRRFWMLQHPGRARPCLPPMCLHAARDQAAFNAAGSALGCEARATVPAISTGAPLLPFPSSCGPMGKAGGSWHPGCLPSPPQAPAPCRGTCVGPGHRSCPHRDARAAALGRLQGPNCCQHPLHEKSLCGRGVNTRGLLGISTLALLRERKILCLFRRMHCKKLGAFRRRTQGIC